MTGLVVIVACFISGLVVIVVACFISGFSSKHGQLGHSQLDQLPTATGAQLLGQLR